VLCLFCAAASAGTWTFDLNKGTSQFKGAIAVKDGNFAFTVAGTQGGSVDANPEADDSDGAHAGQDETKVSGWKAMVASSAVSSDGDKACTGDKVTNGEIETSQGAGAEEHNSASAGQVETTITGEEGSAGSHATNGDSGAEAAAGARVFNGTLSILVQGATTTGSGGASAGQDVMITGMSEEEDEICEDCEQACGTGCAGVMADDNQGNHATSRSTVTNGTLWTNQGAYAAPGNGAMTEQSTLAITCEDCDAKATATSDAVYDVDGEENDKEAHAFAVVGKNSVLAVNQQAIADDPVKVQQDGVVAGTSYGAMGVNAESDDGRVSSFAFYIGGGGIDADNQKAIATGGGFLKSEQFVDVDTEGIGIARSSALEEDGNYADANAFVVNGEIKTGQKAIVTPGDKAIAKQITFIDAIGSFGNANSNAVDEDGNHAHTSDTVVNGVLFTVQKSKAEEGNTAEADQFFTAIIAPTGYGSARSWAMDTDYRYAYTQDEFIAGGLITSQGAHASGGDNTVVAHQATGMLAAVGSADSGAIDSDGNSASTHDAFLLGGMTTFQGAAAGGSNTFFSDVEGAVAGQASNVVALGGGSASSYSMNDGNSAGTQALFLGPGAIEGTKQVATAGSANVLFFGTNGAAAIQQTDEIESIGPGGAWSWATDSNGNYAQSNTTYSSLGEITDLTQGAAAGTVSIGPFDSTGAVAGQQTTVSTLLGTASAGTSSDAADNVHSNTFASVVGPGTISAGQFAAATGDTFAFQNVDVAGISGIAGSSSSDNAGNSAATEATFSLVGEIEDSTQFTAAGSIGVPFFGVNGAVAGQQTGEIESIGPGAARSWATDSIGNYAQSNSTYTGLGEIEDLTQGAAAGTVQIGPFDTTGAVAGQQTTIHTILFQTASAGTSSDAFDGQHTSTSSSATAGLLTTGDVIASQIAAANGAAFAAQQSDLSGDKVKATTTARDDVTNRTVWVYGEANGTLLNSAELHLEQEGVTDFIVPGTVFASQSGSLTGNKVKTIEFASDSYGWSKVTSVANRSSGEGTQNVDGQATAFTAIILPTTGAHEESTFNGFGTGSGSIRESMTAQADLYSWNFPPVSSQTKTSNAVTKSWEGAAGTIYPLGPLGQFARVV